MVPLLAIRVMMLPACDALHCRQNSSKEHRSNGSPGEAQECCSSGRCNTDVVAILVDSIHNFDHNSSGDRRRNAQGEESKLLIVSKQLPRGPDEPLTMSITKLANADKRPSVNVASSAVMTASPAKAMPMT
jgi:hypothetical protein